MTLVKQLGLAALFVVGVVLVTSTPATAQIMPVPVNWGTIELENTGVEGSAWGQATFENVQYAYLLFNPIDFTNAAEIYRGDLTVTCQGLTPRATYSTPAGKFRADRKGNATVTGPCEIALFYDIYYGPGPWESYDWVFVGGTDVQVDVARKSGKSNIIVLTEAFLFPY